jgi:hypothetical protein
MHRSSLCSDAGHKRECAVVITVNSESLMEKVGSLMSTQPSTSPLVSLAGGVHSLTFPSIVMCTKDVDRTYLPFSVATLARYAAVSIGVNALDDVDLGTTLRLLRRTSRAFTRERLDSQFGSASRYLPSR